MSHDPIHDFLHRVFIGKKAPEKKQMRKQKTDVKKRKTINAMVPTMLVD
jgi:hypothetical protein